MTNHTTETHCRACKRSGLRTFLDLGQTAIADRLVKKEQLDDDEPFYPLNVAFCPHCGLVQILETVPPEILFSEDYPYFSSFSDQLLLHSRENVLELIRERGLDSNSFVVEIASNDGYLLKNYLELQIPVLGIDPANGPAASAEAIGVSTLNTFFTLSLAKQLVAEGKKADIIHANNVLAHVADTNGFVEGIFWLLKDTGVAVIEVPYCKDLIDHLEFDTIYHQHLCYFTVTALDNLFRTHNLYLNRVKRLNIHGGSLRLYVEKYENVENSVNDLLAMEKTEGLDTLHYYTHFSSEVETLKQSLVDLLISLKAQGHSIAAYGAAAKGCTLINYAGIGTDFIDFVVDKNFHKQGLYMPGKHIPILAPEELLYRKPDYVLILPWNFSGEILQQQQEYRDQGGKFIIPVPHPQIV